MIWWFTLTLMWDPFGLQKNHDMEPPQTVWHIVVVASMAAWKWNVLCHWKRNHWRKRFIKRHFMFLMTQAMTRLIIIISKFSWKYIPWKLKSVTLWCGHPWFLIIRIERKNEFITDMLNKCDLFWFDMILPELLTRKHKNENINDAGKIENVPPDRVRNDCISNCKVTEACEMVGCDSSGNWYHLSCVKSKIVPKTKTWYCKSCRLETKRKNSMLVLN